MREALVGRGSILVDSREASIRKSANRQTGQTTRLCREVLYGLVSSLTCIRRAWSDRLTAVFSSALKAGSSRKSSSTRVGSSRFLEGEVRCNSGGGR